MEYVVTALVLLAFGYFIYRKVTAKKPPSTGTGVGGGGTRDGGSNVNEN